jgi:adenine-specific DNA-methyltransferase
MIKYIGSKRKLLPGILEAIEGAGDVRTVLDVFSGTSRVGHALKAKGIRVIANDHNAYAHVLATCYVQADAEDVLEPARRVLDELSRLPGRPGFFTETFCERSRYVHPRNGERIDAIRDRIEAMGLEPELKAVVLTSLIEAADRVDSTTGVQMAFLKEWAPRAANHLELRMPRVLARAAHGKGEAHRLDALDVAARFEVDVAYLDPPYNQHSYLGNYHVWETLALWDRPGVYGAACKREDCRERRSEFNSRPKIAEALRRLLERMRARVIVLSFSDEGYIGRSELESLLGELGQVRVVEQAYPRYVGAKIGIHNRAGQRVGRVSHISNTEFLFVVGRTQADSRLSASIATNARPIA